MGKNQTQKSGLIFGIGFAMVYFLTRRLLPDDGRPFMVDLAYSLVIGLVIGFLCLLSIKVYQRYKGHGVDNSKS